MYTAELELSSNSKDSIPGFVLVVYSGQQEDLKEMKLHQQIATDPSLQELNADKEAVPQKKKRIKLYASSWDTTV